MDFALSFENGSISQTLGSTDTRRNLVVVSLFVHQGRMFNAPQVGSRLFLVKKANELGAQLAKNYAAEALKWLTDAAIAKSVVINTEVGVEDRINIAITVTWTNDEVDTFSLFYKVV